MIISFTFTIKCSEIKSSTILKKNIYVKENTVLNEAFKTLITFQFLFNDEMNS